MNRATEYSGTLLGESLRAGAVLDEVPFTVTKLFRAAVEAYGRSLGVPDAQLDWPG